MIGDLNEDNTGQTQSKTSSDQLTACWSTQARSGLGTGDTDRPGIAMRCKEKGLRK